MTILVQNGEKENTLNVLRNRTNRTKRVPLKSNGKKKRA